jgi:hypothetical protein
MEYRLSDQSQYADSVKVQWFVNNQVIRNSVGISGLKDTIRINGKQNIRISQIATNLGCRDSISRSWTASPRPIAKAVFQLSDTVGCVPNLIKMFNQSLYSDTVRWQYLDPNGIWSSLKFLNGTDSILLNQSGSGSIKLYAGSIEGCIDSITKSIRMLDHAKANFQRKDSLSCGKHWIQFIDNSTFSDSVELIMGANTYRFASKTTSPWISFTQNQNLPLVYRSFNRYCDSIIQDTLRFQIRPAINLNAQLTTTTWCLPDSVYTKIQLTDADSLWWNFGSNLSPITLPLKDSLKLPITQAGLYR